MEVDKLKFIANVDGNITCEIFNSLGEPQDITNCHITFNLGREYENEAIISLPMIVFETSKCAINLKPEDTDMLGDKEEYEFNLVIIDSSSKKHVTDKVKIKTDRPIE